MPAPISIGVVGCGGISQMMHLPYLAERPDMFRIAALADPIVPTLEAMGRRYRVERLFADWRPLLDEPLNAVLIASGGAHRDVVLAALAAGKHVFCEKPLGDCVDDIEAIGHVLAGTGLTLMVGYHKRFDPGWRFARDEVRKLSDLRFVRCDVLHPVDGRARDHHWIEPPQDAAVKARQDAETAEDASAGIAASDVAPRIDRIVGVGAPMEAKVATAMLFGSLIHDVNAIRGIVGEPEEVLFAEFWRQGFGLHVVLRWPRDLRGALSWVYLPGLAHYKEEIFFASPGGRVTLTFPSPYFRHFPTLVRVESMVEGRVVESDVIAGMDEAFRLELHHFHECVTTGRTPDTDIREAMADTVLLERIARAYKG